MLLKDDDGKCVEQLVNIAEQPFTIIYILRYKALSNDYLI